MSEIGQYMDTSVSSATLVIVSEESLNTALIGVDVIGSEKLSECTTASTKRLH